MIFFLLLIFLQFFYFFFFLMILSNFLFEVFCLMVNISQSKAYFTDSWDQILGPDGTSPQLSGRKPVPIRLKTSKVNIINLKASIYLSKHSPHPESFLINDMLCEQSPRGYKNKKKLAVLEP